MFFGLKKDEIYQSYQSIISNQWNGVQINANKSTSIKPVKYFHINSVNLYSWSRNIQEKYQITHLREKVRAIESNHINKLTTEKSHYFSEWVFDSRPPNIKLLKKGKFNISQSFLDSK